MSPRLGDVLAETPSIGLRTGHVEVVDHDPLWADLFARLKPLVEESLAGLHPEVEHIGSSSVPDLAAKPILDVAVGLPGPIEAEAIVERLVSLGLSYSGDLGNYGGLLFIIESAPGVVAVHLHVVDVGEFQWRWYLAFRDGLRASPELRRAYEALKRDLASIYESDREGYSQAKFDWVFKTVNDLDDQG